MVEDAEDSIRKIKNAPTDPVGVFICLENNSLFSNKRYDIINKMGIIRIILIVIVAILEHRKKPLLRMFCNWSSS
ncbi:MAG: hypothetical protein ACRCZ2_07025 [Fusobacteriaceae bacterium]